MHGVRFLMGRLYRYAENHGLWEEGRRYPTSKVKIGKKQWKRERKILSWEQTAAVLEHLEEPNGLIIDTCIATSTRISEVTGLQCKHYDPEKGTIVIEQRLAWRY